MSCQIPRLLKTSFPKCRWASALLHKHKPKLPRRSVTGSPAAKSGHAAAPCLKTSRQVATPQASQIQRQGRKRTPARSKLLRKVRLPPSRGLLTPAAQQQPGPENVGLHPFPKAATPTRGACAPWRSRQALRGWRPMIANLRPPFFPSHPYQTERESQ